MAEEVVRSGRKDSFTVLYNSMITDKRLSLKAKGLFAVMMSRPDGWEFSVSGLAAFTGAGKDAIRSTLSELEEVGYLIREQSHSAAGTFGGNVYILQDVAPLSGNPTTVKPDDGKTPMTVKPDDGKNRQRKTPLSGNPTQRNKDLKRRRTKDTPLPPEGEPDMWALFERFWNVYPRRQAKQDARKAWQKLAPDLALCKVMSAALLKQIRSEQWTRDGGRFVPLPATWLNGRRWEDEAAEIPSREAGDEDGI